ncbi:MAG: hypothetical protein ACPL1F_00040 [bacterium]
MNYEEVLNKLNTFLNPKNIYIIGKTNLEEYTPNTGVLFFREGGIEDREKLYTSYSLLFTFADLIPDYKVLYKFIKQITEVLSYIGALDINYVIVNDTGLEGKEVMYLEFTFKILDFLSVVDFINYI